MTDQVTVSKEWLHACGQRQYDTDQAFPVVRHYTLNGWEFWDIEVPWQTRPWTVIEWRLSHA